LLSPALLVLIIAHYLGVLGHNDTRHI
jgi:hypothetical protein